MKKALSLLTILLLPFSAALEGASFHAAFASNNNIEETTPLDDLLGDENFKTAYQNGSYNIGVETGYRIVDFAEYKYGTSGYDLYLYLWNCEQDSTFDFTNPRNRIEIFDQLNEKYVHLNIKYLQKSGHQFYKFKVLFDSHKIGFDVNDTRVYSIVGIETIELGDSNATDYKVGKSYIYSGYYFDESLTCQATDLETLHLDVFGDVYRTNSSSVSATAKNDLYYVAFAVPNEIFNRYGNIAAIHADYYKFDLSNKIGAMTGKLSRIKDSNRDFLLPSDYDDATSGDSDDWYYQWLTYPGLVQNRTEWRYFAYSSNNYFEYINDNSEAFMIPVLDVNSIITGHFLDQLFSLEDVCGLFDLSFDDIALDSESGFYKNVEISSTETYSLESYGDHHNGWENWWVHFSKGTDVNEHDLNDIPAIQVYDNFIEYHDDSTVKDSLFSELAFATLGYNYHPGDSISSNISLLNSFNSSYKTVVFRFFADIYDSTNVVYESGIYIDGVGPVGHSYVTGFAPKRGMNAILDFDIIDITFMDDYGTKTVLPVVANPINIWSSFENTYIGNSIDWSKIIMLILEILIIAAFIILCVWLLTKTFSFQSAVELKHTVKKVKKKKKYRRK